MDTDREEVFNEILGRRGGSSTISRILTFADHGNSLRTIPTHERD